MTRRPAAHASSPASLTLPQLCSLVQVVSSATVTEVGQVRGPRMWSWTQGGWLPFWGRDATSVPPKPRHPGPATPKRCSKPPRRPRDAQSWGMSSTIALVLAGGATIVGVNLLARRTGQPVAVLLVGVGLVYSLLPRPNLVLHPHFVLDVIIPPLVYSAALSSSAVELRKDLRPVIGLSVGLVLVSALAVGGALSAAAGIPLAAGLALGAAVAPPDPVAALSIGRRAGLPVRLITLVAGEGLLNDATALTALQVAAAAAVSGHLSIAGTAAHAAVAAVGGLAVGLAVAIPLGVLRQRIGDPLAENAISLATPFVVYLLAQSFGGSGVLAVVVAGLWFAHRGPTLQSSQSRLQARAVWRLVDYLLEGFVFILIGQQLPAVISGLGGYPISTLALSAAATVLVVLAVRPLWLIATARVPAMVEARAGLTEMSSRHRHLTRKELLALSWSGTRGVITLAAAFTIPLTTGAGRPFPDRDLLLFCAYLVVLTTLVGQGLTFAPLLRRLHLDDDTAELVLLRNQARVAAAKAARDRLEELLADEENLPSSVADGLRREVASRVERFSRRVERLTDNEDGAVPADDPYFIGVRLRRAMIDASRDEYLQWRDTARLSDSSLRLLLNELDHEEGLLPDR